MSPGSCAGRGHDGETPAAAAALAGLAGRTASMYVCEREVEEGG